MTGTSIAVDQHCGGLAITRVLWYNVDTGKRLKELCEVRGAWCSRHPTPPTGSARNPLPPCFCAQLNKAVQAVVHDDYRVTGLQGLHHFAGSYVSVHPRTSVQHGTLRMWLQLPLGHAFREVGSDDEGEGEERSSRSGSDLAACAQPRRSRKEKRAACSMMALQHDILQFVRGRQRHPTHLAQLCIGVNSAPRRYHLLRDIVTRRNDWCTAPACTLLDAIDALLAGESADVDDATWAALAGHRPPVYAPRAIALPLPVMAAQHRRVFFDLHGLVLTRPDDMPQLPDIDAATTNLLVEQGQPIFTSMFIGGDSIGDGMRRQVLGKQLRAPALRSLCALELELRAIVCDLIRAVATDPDMVRVRSPVIIVNDHRHGDMVADAQALHSDMEPLKPHCYNAIAPLEDGVTLLVVPASHRLLALSHQPPSYADFWFGASRLPLMRVTLQRGDILLFHGNLVHAGDAGVPGKAHPRLHWYAQPDTVPNTTSYATGPPAVRDRLPEFDGQPFLFDCDCMMCKSS